MTEPNRLEELVGGKYRIVRFMASGGMGSVYEAQHTVVRRRFAVKFLHRELALRRELLTRFQREAEAAGALESENVAAAVDFGIAVDGAPYIVLEYLVGESLEHLLEREEKLPVQRATNLLQQACRGVQAAHAAGIVHRDLKPHNLFVCRREDGTDLVKVLDFGVAKLEMVEQGVAATRTGTVLGTPSYMSPEQARGEKHIDVHSDVHALGAILYELLSGKKPHPGDSHNAILHHIATQPALPLAAAAPDLPPELIAVVERALAPDQTARFASADALAQALAPWSRPEVWPAPKLEVSAPRHAEPSSTLLAAPVSPSPPPAGPTPSRISEPPRGAAPAPARSNATLIVGGIGVLGVLIAMLLRQPARENERAAPEVKAPAALEPAVKAPAAAEPPALAAPAAAAKVAEASEPTTRIAAALSAAPPRNPASESLPPKPARPTPRTAVTPARAPASTSPSSKPTPDEPARTGPVSFDQKNPYQ